MSTKKNPESEEDLLEHRSDGIDSFDTFILGAESFRSMIFKGEFTGDEIKNLIKVSYNGNF